MKLYLQVLINMVVVIWMNASCMYVIKYNSSKLVSALYIKVIMKPEINTIILQRFCLYRMYLF